MFVALNPGLIFSATHDLTEPLSAALMLAGLLAYSRGRRGIAAAWFALLILSKEQFALVPAGLALWDLLRSSRRIVNAAVLAASIVPAFCWWIYIRIHLGNSFLSDKPFGLPAIEAELTSLEPSERADRAVLVLGPEGARLYRYARPDARLTRDNAEPLPTTDSSGSPQPGRSQPAPG